MWALGCYHTRYLNYELVSSLNVWMWNDCPCFLLHMQRLVALGAHCHQRSLSRIGTVEICELHEIHIHPYVSIPLNSTLKNIEQTVEIRVETPLPLDFYSLNDVPLCPPPFPPLTVTNQNIWSLPLKLGQTKRATWWIELRCVKPGESSRKGVSASKHETHNLLSP